MVTIHGMGFSRMGASRELKFALESYWSGKTGAEELRQAAAQTRRFNWELQRQHGVELIPTNDFSLYDTVLDMSVALGNVPQRFSSANSDLDLRFLMGRGRAPNGTQATACEMTKWFNSNYHYIVPELRKDSPFRPEAVDASGLVSEIREAQQLGYRPKPVLIGPCTYLWLSKVWGDRMDKLTYMDALVHSYNRLLSQIRAAGVEWIQLDEPVLALDLDSDWQVAIKRAYRNLDAAGHKLMLATYFAPLRENLNLALGLKTDGLHLDLINADSIEEANRAAAAMKRSGVLSLGIVDGRSVWAADLAAVAAPLASFRQRLGNRLWISSSCSLQFVPVDLELETKMDPQIKSWLAFAKQKLIELQIVKRVLEGDPSVAPLVEERTRVLDGKRRSKFAHNLEVRQRVESVTEAQLRRPKPHAQRYELQKAALGISEFPTTTVGSFPQTRHIRRLRSQLRTGKISQQEYNKLIREQICMMITKQQEYGLDILVHGEPERNDMVEYFGEQLDGYVTTQHGWVQSYGSRCVKPPLIVGDVSRPHPMTVDWISYAQSLTDKPVKGMLTGPTTMMAWSFVRSDVPYEQVKQQIALALRDEVADLELAGIKAIQVDEPAFREALPLRHKDQERYLKNAVDCFRLVAGCVRDETQIHAHMCYADFTQIINFVADLDADVLLIEGTRSNMRILQSFRDFKYPNQIGVGVFDIHSPNAPPPQEMNKLLKLAANYLTEEQVWVTPDCGLKTRRWEEVDNVLPDMVAVARKRRSRINA